MKNYAPQPVFTSIAELLTAKGIAAPPLFADFHMLPLYAFGPVLPGEGAPPYRQHFYQISLLRAVGAPAQNSLAPAYSIHTLTPDTTYSGQRDPATMGYRFYFTEDFLPLPPGALVHTFSFVQTPVLPLDEVLFDDLLGIGKAMLLESRNGPEATLRLVLQHYLLILLHKCQAAQHRRDQLQAGQPRALRLVDRFRQLLDTHYLHYRSVAGYARLLDVTPGHLNDSVKEATGQSAGTLIQARLLAEAKHLLTFSSMEMARIAEHLQFSDPSHFGKFFKRATGVTPFEFRRRQAPAP